MGWVGGCTVDIDKPSYVCGCRICRERATSEGSVFRIQMVPAYSYEARPLSPAKNKIRTTQATMQLVPEPLDPSSSIASTWMSSM